MPGAKAAGALALVALGVLEGCVAAAPSGSIGGDHVDAGSLGARTADALSLAIPIEITIR
jgi:hypothetical protein